MLVSPPPNQGPRAQPGTVAHRVRRSSPPARPTPTTPRAARARSAPRAGRPSAAHHAVPSRNRNSHRTAAPSRPIIQTPDSSSAAHVCHAVHRTSIGCHGWLAQQRSVFHRAACKELLATRSLGDVRIRGVGAGSVSARRRSDSRPQPSRKTTKERQQRRDHDLAIAATPSECCPKHQKTISAR